MLVRITSTSRPACGIIVARTTGTHPSIRSWQSSRNAPWRSRNCVSCNARDGTTDDRDLDQLLQEDLKRLQSREQELRSEQGSSSVGPPESSLKELVDKALIADFFFILFALGWLGAGVGLKSATGVTGLLDAWLALWQWVFQPAIGVLMLGALVSGGIGWLREKGSSS